MTENKRKVHCGARQLYPHDKNGLQRLVDIPSCDALLVVSDPYYILNHVEKTALKSANVFEKQFLQQRHRYIYNGILGGPSGLVGALSFIGMLLVMYACCIIILRLLYTVYSGEVPLMSYLQDVLLGAAGWLSMVLFARCSRKIPDKYYRIFDRHESQVIFPGKISKQVKMPFSEFDSYYSINALPNGTHRYTLWYAHRYSSVAFSVGTGSLGKLYVMQGFYQQFMDIDKPLPDVPLYENCRQLDQATRHYDQLHHRQANYWALQSKAQLTRALKAAFQRAKTHYGGKLFR